MILSAASFAAVMLLGPAQPQTRPVDAPTAAVWEGEQASAGVTKVERPDPPEPTPEAEPPEPAPAEEEEKPAGYGVHGFAGVDGGFGVEANDGKFGVQFGFLGQLRYSAVAGSGQVEQGFELKLARPTFGAHLFGKRLILRFMPEFAGGSPYLLDAQMTLDIHEAFKVHFGQDRPWASRGFRVGLPFTVLVDRGQVVNALRLDRDVGITLMGQPFGGRMEYYVGVYNGDGPNSLNVDEDMLYTARLVVAPLGPVGYDQTPYISGHDELRVAFGGNAYTVDTDAYEDVEDPATGEVTRERRPDKRTIGASGDVALSGGRIASMGEVFLRQTRQNGFGNQNAWGAYGMLSVLVVKRWFDVAARAGALDLDQGQGVRLPFEGGFNVYFVGNHAKLAARYTCTVDPGEPGCETHAFVAQLQGWF
jgi:hypothetical protein